MNLNNRYSWRIVRDVPCLHDAAWNMYAKTRIWNFIKIISYSVQWLLHHEARGALICSSHAEVYIFCITDKIEEHKSRRHKIARHSKHAEVEEKKEYKKKCGLDRSIEEIKKRPHGYSALLMIMINSLSVFDAYSVLIGY